MIIKLPRGLSHTIVYSGVCTKEEANRISKLMSDMINKEKK